MLASLAIATVGCASKENIPTYPLVDPPQAIQTIRERSAKLEKFTGRGAVTLSNAKRGSIRLDAAFVIAPPGFARIRGWKFSQAVFDLTVRPEGVWLFAPRDQNDSIASTRGNIGDSVRQWLRYLRGDLDTAGADVSADAHTITITRPQEDGTRLESRLDRATLTVRRYRLLDTSGVERFRLTLDRYAMFGDTVWPTRIEAKSPTGTITIETGELQPNVASEKAFAPPPRATRLP